MPKFPFFSQLDATDCGPSCLRMVARFYGKKYSVLTLRQFSGIGKQGVSLYGISEAAEQIGFRTLAVKTTIEEIVNKQALPFIAHWRQNHFVVVYKIKNEKIYVADPAIGLNNYSKKEFYDRWISSGTGSLDYGVALLLEPSQDFYKRDDEPPSKLGFKLLFKYLFTYKKLLTQLIAGLLLGSVIQLIFPFLTQAVVDVGIGTSDLKFIYIVMIGQLMLFLGQTSIDFIRAWILLHINSRINILLLTDFLGKLMRLPISFFESKMIGDILQRINDQQRIQSFLTGPALNIAFSIVNFIIFSVIMILYNRNIFFIFLTGSIIYICWVLAFQNYKKKIDYKQFEVMSQNQSNLVELVYGMQEIKMNTCETQKKWQWERLQAKIFKINMKGLVITQYQQGGAVFINQVKNIFITIFSATAVVKSEITLGSMLAIQYMVGQLNGPIEQLIQFIQSIQQATISMERMNEIHDIPNEEPENLVKIKDVPSGQDLRLHNVSFKYNPTDSQNVLDNINLLIPYGKTTAIVGMSGSGKTTLLKLLMKFYSPTEGTINLGNINLDDILNKSWRSICGVVMQENYIFSDSIARNIAVSDEEPSVEKLLYATKVANIQEFINSLPLSFNTTIGSEGAGISQGQRQRLLIARAVYKNPAFIFLDEATNSLDTNNEMVIMENLTSFFTNKTVIIAAHRLSTVKNADQIIVLDNGRIVERGSHDELLLSKGAYYKLIKHQLELNTL